MPPLPPVRRQDFEDFDRERTLGEAYREVETVAADARRVAADFDEVSALADAARAEQTTSWLRSAHDQVSELAQRARQTAAPVVEAAQQAGGDLVGYARRAAEQAGIDPDVFVRQIRQESGFRPDAVSPAGARGVAQIMPQYHPSVDPDDPYASLNYAAGWMKQLLGRYGGDYRRALAAYNAGPGAVDQHGGVPPFEETQRYVSTILGGPTDDEGVASRPRAGAAPAARVEALGQFELGLPDEEAFALCGPVAAIAFAQANGRNPTLDEARQLARESGWTARGGMNGVANQKALLDRMGVPARLDTAPQIEEIAADAASGNPVIVSTPQHYYYVNGFDPETGKLHVGKTGTSRKGGSTWMTAQEIARLDGGINGVLYVDNPNSPTPSVAAAQPTETGRGDSPELAGPPSRYLGPELGRPFDPTRDVPGFEPRDLLPTNRRYGPWAGLEALGEGSAEYLRRAPGGETALELLREQGRRNVENLRLMGTPGDALDPEQQDRAWDAALEFGMTSPAIGSIGRRVVGETAERVGASVADEVERLRLDKFPEPVRDLIARAAGSGDFWREQRRGVIPDAEAEEMADRLGRSVDQMVRGGRIGRAYNAEETRAIRNALVAQSIKVSEMAREFAANPARATDELIAQQIAEGIRLADLSRVAEGARAEAGRTLRAYQSLARDFAADPVDATQRIFRIAGDRETAVKRVNEYVRLVDQGAGPFEMANFWARVEKPPPGFNDWFQALRYNSMLSGPRTVLVNAIGNALEIPWRLGRDTAASVARGRPEEIGQEWAGMLAGWGRGVEAAKQVLQHGITQEQALRGDVPRSLSSRLENPVARGAALGLESVGRVLGATDELVRQTAYGMAIGREAAVAASRRGLRGEAWKEAVADFLAEPPADAMKRALGIADRMTFKSDLGQLASGIEVARGRAGILGHIVLPFMKTVANITARAVDRSPLGLAGTTVDLARGQYGPLTAKNLREQLSRPSEDLPSHMVPLGERLSDNVLGTVAFGWFLHQALQGNVTGAGPDDPEKREMLRAQGWQPYSVRLPVVDQWLSYANLGPFAFAIASAAAPVEAARFAKPGAGQLDLMLDGARRFAQVVQEQSFLQTVGDIWKAFDDPERWGTRLVESLAQTLVPFGAAINTVGQATDPHLRATERGDIAEAIQVRLPGARQALPVRQDVLGRPVNNQQQGAMAISPLRFSQPRPDPIVMALLDAGVDLPFPPKTVKNLQLTEDERRRFQELAGEQIERELRGLVERPSFAGVPSDRKKQTLQRAVDKAREAAAEQLLREIGMSEVRLRLREQRERTGATP